MDRYKKHLCKFYCSIALLCSIMETKQLLGIPRNLCNILIYGIRCKGKSHKVSVRVLVLCYSKSQSTGRKQGANRPLRAGGECSRYHGRLEYAMKKKYVIYGEHICNIEVWSIYKETGLLENSKASSEGNGDDEDTINIRLWY